MLTIPMRLSKVLVKEDQNSVAMRRFDAPSFVDHILDLSSPSVGPTMNSISKDGSE